jgi:aryl-alcohol dehydrogenase-like predicted oxidoreductase
MSYGSPSWRPWVLDAEASKPFFRAAIEAGINFFDTADVYSDGASEEVTGTWLSEFGVRDELVIATKVHFPMSDRPNMGGLSRKHIQQACENSLRRPLGVDTIDLYQIHRLDPNTPPEETLAALDYLVTSGKVRYIGASSMYAWELMKLLSISERNGWARFVSMQDHYNLLYREDEREMHPLCSREGIGLIPWSPMARGLLAGTRRSIGDGDTVRATTDGIDALLYTSTPTMTWLAPFVRWQRATGARWPKSRWRGFVPSPSSPRRSSVRRNWDRSTTQSPRLPSSYPMTTSWLSKKGTCRGLRPSSGLPLCVEPWLDDRPGALRDRLVEVVKSWRDWLAAEIGAAQPERSPEQIDEIVTTLVGISMSINQEIRLLADPGGPMRARSAMRHAAHLPLE